MAVVSRAEKLVALSEPTWVALSSATWVSLSSPTSVEVKALDLGRGQAAKLCGVEGGHGRWR